MSEKENKPKEEEENPNNLPNKPEKIKKFRGNFDPNRSKSAPIEAFEKIQSDDPYETFEKIQNDDNYISTYEYYQYYYSLKPINPRLPKPTYIPEPNLEFIRESKKELEEDEKLENPNLNPNLENITNDIQNLNLD